MQAINILGFKYYKRKSIHNIHIHTRCTPKESIKKIKNK